MFLTLVFLAELVAGVSGFIFRHEVSHSHECQLMQISSLVIYFPFFHVVWVCVDQIKAKMAVAYKNAVKNYNSTDSVSSAVDVIQRTVSGRISITLMAPPLSASVCVALHKCLHKASL